MYGKPTEDKAKRSWAVITGGSDGIGFEMAKEATQNHKYNICIVGRNLEKI